MANKKVKCSFRGSTKDITKSKHPFEYYFEGQHLKLLATSNQSTASVTNEKGNSLVVTIPSITINTSTNVITYGSNTLNYVNSGEIDEQIIDGNLPTSSSTQKIIGYTTTREGLVLLTTDDLGMDCIWLVDNVLDDSYNLSLLYVRNLGFSSSAQIQVIFNYENENIQKIYWVDGIHQIRFLNITHDSIEDNDPLIDVPSNSLNFVGTVSFSQPIIQNVVGGGTHTAGMIQYAYNLYRLNSSQSKISPLSELVSLDKGNNLGGGALNDIVGAAPVINISNIDTSYTHIKIYAIKYTSYNEIPSINLIEEREIDSSSITIYDDGSTISSLSLEEFLFLGSDPYIPKHIESKDNRLFLANLQTKEFVLPDELDTRAYSFPISSTTTNVWSNPQLNSAGSIDKTKNKLPVTSAYLVPLKHDSINLDYDINKYQYNSTILGGTGKYIKYQLVQQSAAVLGNTNDLKFLKDREIYRIGIQFYNRLGQISLPKWIADFKAPSGNLSNSFNTLKVEFTTSFISWLNSYPFESEDDIPVGYKIVRADRTINDRTIICQGLLSGMMVNSPRDTEGASLYNTTEKRIDSQSHVKLPNFLVRTFQTISPLKPNSHLEAMQFGNTGGLDNPLTEIQYEESERKADTYQYTAMYQMYSPEVMFESVSLNSATKFNVIGGMTNTANNFWGQKRNVANQIPEVEGKTLNKLTPNVSGGTEVNINGDISKILNRGLISETNGSNPNIFVAFLQWYREFNGLVAAPNLREYYIYGSPEVTARGQSNTIYNNNSKYEYSNSLEGFLTDGEDEFKEDGPTDRAIISLNSFGAQCVTFVADDGSDTDIQPHLRPLMETLYANSGLSATNLVLISELIRPSADIYLSGIYGGNSYEDKKRTTYLEIGQYTDITTTSIQINSPGDTFVQEFKFMRIGKTDTEVYSLGVNQMTELVSIMVETTVDLKNRNDISIGQWDSNFQPQYVQYHEYNRVYSQQPTLVQNEDVDFTFKRIKNFDTRIQATKLKIPNESIDSWTDILVNEILDLDGKYGPINNILAYEDKMFTFQDEAIAGIAINPRVQVQGNDGIGIELGIGGILYDYNYITTKSGSINKWGIVRTKKGIYYYDALNKAIGRLPDAVKIFLSDAKGYHSYFNNNFNYSRLVEDNPVNGFGAVLGYDNYNNDVYITLLQDDAFTLCYNELKEEFIDNKTYTPSMYINKGEKLLLPNSNNNKLYEHYKGNYNTFFGVTQSTYIILQLNPEADYDCIFDNIHFNSEIYLNDIDQSDKTLTHIQAYNEYQDSGRIPLVNARSGNLRRKFREWRADIPRDGRNRIRNPWIFLKLELENTSNYELILHDIIVLYTI